VMVSESDKVRALINRWSRTFMGSSPFFAGAGGPKAAATGPEGRRYET